MNGSACVLASRSGLPGRLRGQVVSGAGQQEWDRGLLVPWDEPAASPESMAERIWYAQAALSSTWANVPAGGSLPAAMHGHGRAT